MPLLIQTTGLEEYAPGGKARVKVLNIGGPGAGKTRFASYFPAPIFADCERGLASVADRRVPYVNINSTQDMQDLLAMLKQECKLPAANRKYQTIVIDTLDAFQRKVKNEWMEVNKKDAFSGWEAWGFLGSKMQMLMTRLLNLDMNVVVNVHFKDKTTKDDATGRETHELMLQLQGETADTAFNDFDLVGWTGVYWEADEGQRVQKRGITFKATPDKPFLKDRLHCTPDWLPITFADSDYTNLFERIQARVQEMAPGEVLGEVPSETPAPPPPMVMAPGAVGSGALPATAVRPKADVPLTSLDKPTLAKVARDLGITTTVSGAPIRANTIKAELIEAIEAHRARPEEAKETPDAAPAATPAPPAAQPEPAAPTEDPKPAPAEPVKLAPATSGYLIASEAGMVDRKTGELLDEPAPAPVDEHEQAVQLVEMELGGTVVSDQVTVTPKPEPKPEPKPAPKPAAQPHDKSADNVCGACGKSLEGENPDFLKLAWIKYRERLCQEDYQKRKTAR